MYARALIEDSYFTRNEATKRSKNIFVGFSTLKIYHTTFRQKMTEDQDAYALTDTSQGSFIFIIIDVELTIERSQFLDGTGYEGGAIYLSGASSIEIKNSGFFNNIANTYGGALYAAAFSSIKISESTTFGDNRVNLLGDDIYVANSENTIELDGFEIYNKYASTSIYVESAGITMNDGYIHDIRGSADSSRKGGAL